MENVRKEVSLMINVSLMIKRKSFRAILFLSILMVLFFISSRVLGFKYVDGIYSMKKFYEQDKGTVDVLALGSSHMFESVNTSVLFEESLNWPSAAVSRSAS